MHSGIEEFRTLNFAKYPTAYISSHISRHNTIGRHNQKRYAENKNEDQSNGIVYSKSSLIPVCTLLGGIPRSTVPMSLVNRAMVVSIVGRSSCLKLTPFQLAVTCSNSFLPFQRFRRIDTWGIQCCISYINNNYLHGIFISMSRLSCSTFTMA